MNRAVLIAVLPYLAGIVLSLAVLVAVLRLSGAKANWRWITRLHADQHGGVQSLSFVLTLPLFMMIMMFIVQLSQLTIARVVVEYAAFSAARSAMVWIPASFGFGLEEENQISFLEWKNFEEGFDIYEIQPGSLKYDKIRRAAALACMPICPSRPVDIDGFDAGLGAYDSLLKTYYLTAPEQAANVKVPDRLRNKLAYALSSTDIEIEIRHKDSEPPLAHWDVLPYTDEFRFNEIGFQDQVFVTVTHDFALLPGPGRLLARRASARPGTSPQVAPGTDSVARRIERNGRTYVYPLSATVRLNNEGEKPILPYVQRIHGMEQLGVPGEEVPGQEEDGPIEGVNPGSPSPGDLINTPAAARQACCGGNPR